MAVGFSNTNKPINPRGNDASPKGYNRASLYSGKALDFDGTNDYVEVADNASLDFTTAMSAFCYARVDSTSGSGHLFSKFDYGTNQRSWTIQKDDAKLRVIISVNGFSGTNTKNYYSETFENTSDYYFVGYTFESNVLKLYVNGQEVTTTKTNDAEITSIFSGSAKVAVGAIQNSGAGASFFDGKIANARAFNVGLTAAQVADLYNNPEKVVPTGVADSALKLWLPMQEGAGTTAYDGSGNGNHGTISGATWQHGIGAPVSQTAVIDWNKGTNLVKYSEELDRGSYWSKTNTAVTANDATAPDGQQTAELFKETTATGSHYINVAVTTAASTTYVQSVWVKKKDDGIFAGVRTNGVGGNSYIIFDFDTATIVATGSDIISKGVETYSNGWYRIYMTYTLAPTGAIYSVTNSSSSVIPSYAGTGKGYYIWGAQLEASDSLTAYIPNHTATPIASDVLLPQGLTTGRDITGVNLFENVRKQGALNLDGNSWAEVHDNASLDMGTGGFTLEVWAKLAYENTGSSYNAVLGLGTALSAGATAYIYTRSAGPRFFINGSSFTIAAALDNGNWHHLVVTRTDAGAIQTYYDGAEGEDSGTEASTMTNTYDVLIGKDTGAARYYKDQITQPRIYNRALTASEVLQNYNSGKNTYK